MYLRRSFAIAAVVELIGEILSETGVAPEYLELELTETLLLSTGHITIALLGELKSHGCVADN